jgi:hypothetical protein
MPVAAEQCGDGLMARATETEEILQGLVAEMRIGCMMHLGRHMLMPQLTAIAVALEHQATFLAPGVTSEIAEIGALHAHLLSCLAWPGSPRFPLPLCLERSACGCGQHALMILQHVTGHSDVPAASRLIRRSMGGTHYPLAHGLSCLTDTAGFGNGQHACGAAARRTVHTVTGISPAAPIGHAASLCERINDAVYAPQGQTLSTFVEVSLSRNRLMLSVGPPNGVFEAKVPDPPTGQ